MPGRNTALFLSLYLALTFPFYPAQASQYVRVLIKEENPSIEIKAKKGVIVFDLATRKTLETQSEGSSLSIGSNSSGFLLEGRQVLAEALEVKALGDEVLEIDGSPYRGWIEIHRKGTGAVSAINVLDLENYLKGIMKVEISPGWPLEAMKAQAVVARSYALYQVQQNPYALFHLKATTASQVYRGINGEDPRSTLAVRATEGVVLTYRGKVIPTFYHACSGGYTEDATEVWGGEFPYSVGVADEYCLDSPYSQWEVNLEVPNIRKALLQEGYQVGDITALTPIERSRSGRIKRLGIRHSSGLLELEGKKFRQILGYDVIKSTNFNSTVSGGIVKFQGKGWGHGVGLSQWGAKEMAERAYSFEEILKYYYPLAELKRLE